MTKSVPNCIQPHCVTISTLLQVVKVIDLCSSDSVTIVTEKLHKYNGSAILTSSRGTPCAGLQYPWVPQNPGRRSIGLSYLNNSLSYLNIMYFIRIQVYFI